MIQSLFNFGLRGAGLLGKFLLVFFLARMLAPEDLGTYGLVTATVAYAMFFLGMDFYTYAGRAMLQAGPKAWPNMLRDQAVLFACSYMVFMPLLGLLFAAGLLPAEHAVAFFVLLGSEHLSQEFVRLLVIIGRPVAAGVLLFIRTGGWCYLLVAGYVAGIASVDLSTVFMVWSLANAIALVGSAWALREVRWSELTPGIDWAWIRSGLRTAMVFLVGTLALRALFTLDRYLLEIFSNREMVGVYTLYFGVCNSLIAFVDAAVFSFRYPKLVSLYRTRRLADFEAARRVFARQTFVAVGLLAMAAAVLVIPVLRWIGKPVYLQHLPVFYMLLAASVLFVAGHVPHFALYAMGQDRSIVAAHLGGFLTFVVLGVLLAPGYQLGGVATALLVAIGFMGAFKQWRFASLHRSEAVARS